MIHFSPAPSADAPPLSVVGLTFGRDLLQRLPLADVTLHVLRFALDDVFLEQCFQTHRGCCYHDLLSFPSLVQIVSDALLVHGGSGRKALLAADRHDRLPTCNEAFYAKLRRLPLPLSVAFLSEASRRLDQLLPPCRADDHPLPASLRGYEIRILDGKKTKHVAKRLKLTRTQAGQLFGAKLLVGYNPVTRLIQAMSADLDGEKNDAPLVPDLLAQLRQDDPGPDHADPNRRERILVVDAQFCDLVQITQYRTGRDHFVIRSHPKMHFHADPAHPACSFVDAKGRQLIQEYGWVGSPRDGRRCFVRRVTWKRTDHKDLCIVTDLTDRRRGEAAERIAASDLIELYLIRWTIETVFQDVTALFHLRKLIGSTAEATAFQAAFCMVAYNAVQVVRAWVAASQVEPMRVDDVSGTMLFDSIRKQLTAAAELLGPGDLASLVEQPATAEQTREYLGRRLAGVWERGWKKARNAKRRSYGPKPKGSGAHTSVDRVLRKHQLQPKDSS